MKNSKVLKTILLIFVFFSILYLFLGKTNKITTKLEDINIKKGYVVYYFRTTYRCTSCTTLERYAEETLLKNFKDEIQQKLISWYSIDVQSKEHEHFIKDFNIFTKSIIIVEISEGKIVRWKNLDNIWNLLSNKEEFQNYIVKEIKKFMEKN